MTFLVRCLFLCFNFVDALCSSGVVDSAYPGSQPSTPDRLLFPRALALSSPHTTPTPPLTPSSATTTANSNAWRSPTSPLTVANVRLAADEGEHGIGLGLGLPFGQGVLDEDRALRSLSLNDGGDDNSNACLLLDDGHDDAEGRYLLVRRVSQE